MISLFRFLFLILIFGCGTLTNERSKLSEQRKKELSRQLKPFSSDGCSMWPDGTRSKPDVWLKCCYKHDRVYWLGGTELQRKNADIELRECVKKEFSDFMGILMYMGVRVGGTPGQRTSYRWGYGWTYDRGYVALTKEEFEFAQKLSPFNESLIEIK